MEIHKTGKIHYIRPLLSPSGSNVSAGFTTRHEGVSRQPYNSLNLGFNTNDTSLNVQGNRSLLARGFGATAEQLLTVTQVHGSDLLVLDSPNQDVTHFLKIECDGIVTNQPGIMIAVAVADCVPLLLLDPVKNVSAALHAGWKGTAAAIARKGVEAMKADFGCRPEDIRAALGPSICQSCYEVDETVKKGFSSSITVWDQTTIPSGNGFWKLDLAAANRLQLIEAGVIPTNIEMPRHCVSCINELFFSYRRDKGETGRHLAFILLS